MAERRTPEELQALLQLVEGEGRFPRDPRDGADLDVATLDPSGRLMVRRLLDAMGWLQGHFYGDLSGRAVRVYRRGPGKTGAPARVDSAGRLCLSRPLLFALDAHETDRLVVFAHPATDEMFVTRTVDVFRAVARAQ